VAPAVRDKLSPTLLPKVPELLDVIVGAGTAAFVATVAAFANMVVLVDQ
jgi:hypothetical protein